MPRKRQSFSILYNTVFPSNKGFSGRDFNLLLDLAIGSIQALHEFYMACNFEVASYDTLDDFSGDLSEQFSPSKQTGLPEFLNNVLVRIPGPIDTCCFVDFERKEIILLRNSGAAMQKLQSIGKMFNLKMKVLQFKSGQGGKKYDEVLRLVQNKTRALYLSGEDVAELTPKLTKYLCSINRQKHGEIRPGNIWYDDESHEVMFTRLRNYLPESSAFGSKSRFSRDIKNPDYSSYYSPPKDSPLRDKKTDIYSLGMVFLVMFTYSNPPGSLEKKGEWTEIYLDRIPIKVQAERDGCGNSQAAVNKLVRNGDSLDTGMLKDSMAQKFTILSARENAFGLTIIDSIVEAIIRIRTIANVKDSKEADVGNRLSDLVVKDEEAEVRNRLSDAKEHLEQAKKVFNEHQPSGLYEQAGGSSEEITPEKNRLSENEQGVREGVAQEFLQQQQDCVLPQPGVWKKFASKWRSMPLGYKIIAVMAIAVGVGAIVYGCVFCPPVIIAALPFIGSVSASAIATFGGAILVGITTIAHTIHVACTKTDKISASDKKKASLDLIRRRLDFPSPQRGRWQKFASKWKSMSLGYKFIAVMAIAAGVGAIVYGCVFCPPVIIAALPFIGSVSASAIATFGGAAVVGVTAVAHAIHVACTKSAQSNISGTGDSAVAAGVAPPDSSTDIIPVSKKSEQAAVAENVAEIKQACGSCTLLYSRDLRRLQQGEQLVARVIKGEDFETPIKRDGEAGQAAAVGERPSTPLSAQRELQGSEQAIVNSAQITEYRPHSQDSVTAMPQLNKRHSCPPNFCSSAFFPKDGGVPPGTLRNTAEKASNTPKWGASGSSDSSPRAPLLSASGSSQPEQDLSESTCSIL